MISIKNLNKYYGSFHALKGISFNVDNNEIVGILGPNGAGKSTTLRILTGFLNPSSGEALIDGKSILEESRNIKKIIGYLPESAPLYNDMVAYDYLMYTAGVQEVANEKINERMEYVVNVCSLKDVIYKPIGTLSKGYKQRVGLAGAIIHNPKILILDEPTNGLDPNQIVEIRELIKTLGKEKIVLLSTHILSEVEASCQRVIIINKGNIILDSPTSEVVAKQGLQCVINLTIKTSDNTDYSDGNHIEEKIKSLARVQSIKVENIENNIKRISIVMNKSLNDEKDEREIIYKLIKSTDCIIYEMTKEKEDLESVFMTLTKGEDK